MSGSYLRILKMVESKQQIILKHYGLNHQLLKADEELTELTQEINLFLCGEGNIDALASEIADVENMLDQLKHALALECQVKRIKLEKCDRELLRIEESL
ncbi:coil containing protein [Vibrio phage 1.155.O._10N.222.55.B3]|nr:coil containing protein [Vibrio phage 1.155.O._10N.222.55.B3]